MADPAMRRSSAAAVSIWPDMLAQAMNARIEWRVGTSRGVGR